MNLRAGTSGYSYKEWKGSFYPEDLAAAKMLRFYAERLSTVEINNTFYRMPSEKNLRDWSSQVPDGFAFALKAPRRITHDKRMKDTADDVAYLTKVAACLEEKRGPFLFQLPPFLRKDIPVLRAFLEDMPADVRPAFEFRHQSWFDDEVFAVLHEHKAALCVADAETDLDVPFIATTAWGYVRLRRPDYSDSDLRTWLKRIQDLPWQEAFVFFKHEDLARGPQFASRFLELAKS